MNKSKLFWKLIIPMVLLISNTAFSQALKISSISDRGNAFVLTTPKDAAKESPERVFGANFVDYLPGEFDVKMIMTYPRWRFSSMTISGAAADGTPTSQQYYEIYNADTREYLRYSEKDKKLKLVSEKDYEEIMKKKEGTMDYVQSFKVRSSFWFHLKPSEDYVRLYRCDPTGISFKIGSKYNNPMKLILVEKK